MLRDFIYSLRGKLLVFSLLLVIGPGVIVAAVTIVTARRALENAVGLRLAAAAQDTAAEMSDLIVREEKKVRSWARQELMRDLEHGDPDRRIARYLAIQQESDPAYVDLRCTDANGRVVAATDAGQVGQDHAKRRWVRTTRRGKDFISVPTTLPNEPHTLLDIAVPIHDPEHGNRIIGALRGRYDWDRGQAPAARTQRNSEAFHLRVDIAVLDRHGMVVAEAPPLHGEGFLDRNLRQEGWLAAQGPHHGAAPRFGREPGQDFLVGYAGLHGPFEGWTALVSQPMQDAFAPIERLQRRILVLLAGVLSSAMGVALLLAERMIRPLRELTTATEEIARRGETAQPVPVRSRDEIGQLATAFNAMTEHIKSAQDDLVTAAKFAFVGEVAAGVAHEVRTPLGILRSSAQILRRNLDPSQAQTSELVDMIVSEVDRLDRVVDGLLELSRPHEPQMEATALQPLLARALDFVEGQASEQGAALQREWADDQPDAYCDAEQIYQVALNLIVNALQLLPRGRGRLLVRTLPETGGRVGFEVWDNGPGIPAADRERIFAPFFSMRKGGTGLGLALVQRVVKAHHGSVTVREAPGGGAAFRVLLPKAEGR